MKLSIERLWTHLFVISSLLAGIISTTVYFRKQFQIGLSLCVDIVVDTDQRYFFLSWCEILILFIRVVNTLDCSVGEFILIKAPRSRAARRNSWRRV